MIASDVDAQPAESRGRAQPMPPDQRRAWIAESAVPLFLARGAALSTRELAERLGIAEGTIFRAFGDKPSLVRAAVHAFFDQGRERIVSGLVDPALPFEDKVAVIVRDARVRMQEVFTMLSLLDRDEVPEFATRPRGDAYRDALAAALAPDAERLRIPLERISAVVRVAVVSAGMGRFGEDARLSDEELVDFILHGIAGSPRGRD